MPVVPEYASHNRAPAQPQDQPARSTGDRLLPILSRALSDPAKPAS
jgi:hypothetical protein